MPECRFCQAEIESKNATKIVEPNGATTLFCGECAAILVRYLTSGKAEEDTLQSLQDSDVLPTPNSISTLFNTLFTNGPTVKSIPMKKPVFSYVSTVKPLSPIGIKTNVLDDDALFPYQKPPTLVSNPDDDDVPF